MKLQMPNINWQNVIGNLGAIVYFAKSVYPNLTGETLLIAMRDGTLAIKAFDLAIVYVLLMYGKRQPKQIEYVVPEDAAR